MSSAWSRTRGDGGDIPLEAVRKDRFADGSHDLEMLSGVASDRYQRDVLP